MSIRKRIIIPLISLAIGGSITVLFSSIFLFNRELNRALHDKIDVALNVVEHEIDNLKANARIAAIGMANNPDLIEAIRNNDRAKIINVANNLQTMARIDYCTILESDGTVLTRTHEPTQFGDNLGHLPHVVGAKSGNIGSYVAQGIFIRLGAYAGAPIYDNDKLIGIVSLGYRLNTQDFVHFLKDLTMCEVSVFLYDERVSSTVLNVDGTYVLGVKAEVKVSAKVLTGEQFTHTIGLYGKDVLAKYTPLYGANNKPKYFFLISFGKITYTQHTYNIFISAIQRCVFSKHFFSEKPDSMSKLLSGKNLCANVYLCSYA